VAGDSMDAAQTVRRHASKHHASSGTRGEDGAAPTTFLQGMRTGEPIFYRQQRSRQMR
jgi:hypothetical protein